MSDTKFNLSPERLRQVVRYDPDTGIFTRIVRTGTKVKIGDRAGHLSGRYISFCVDARHFLAHRLAWLYVHGTWPNGIIDHINGDRTDNRLCNLRDVSQQTNLQNIRAATATNSSGFLGVLPARYGKWCAQIRINGVRVHLGTFKDPQSAHEAYLAAKRKHHEGCTI